MILLGTNLRSRFAASLGRKKSVVADAESVSNSSDNTEGQSSTNAGEKKSYEVLAKAGGI